MKGYCQMENDAVLKGKRPAGLIGRVSKPLFFIGMLLLSASCGIPPEAQGTQPEELEGSRTQALSVDLDGDGTDESVTYRRTAGGFELAIDGKELGEELAAAGLRAENAHDECLAVDLDTADGFVEIAVMSDGGSADHRTDFVRFDGGGAVYLGGVPGLVNGEAPAAVPDGEGGVSSYVSFELLQRWTFPAEYRLENGRMTVEMQEFYVDEALKTFNKTALIQLAAYDSPEGDGRHVIDAGTALALYGAAPAEEPDGEGWVLAGDESGKPHYLRAAFPGAVENAAGEWTAAADAIAGLELYG